MRQAVPFRRLVLASLVLALAGCATTAPRPAPPLAIPVRPAQPAQPAATVCTTCGRIERIDAVAGSGATPPRGAVLGGVVGGVLARPAPAAAGAKPPATAARGYRLVVLLDSGRRLILTQALAPGMKVGSRVRVDRSRAVLLR